MAKTTKMPQRRGGEKDESWWKEISDLFLPAYNSVNGTDFTWHSYAPGREDEIDWLFKGDAGQLLKVQQVASWGTKNDVDMELIRPKYARLVIDELRIELERYGVSNLHVSLNFSNPPSKKEDRKTAVFWISQFVSEKARRESTAVYSFMQEDYDNYLKKITPWVSDLTLYPSESLSFGFSWSPYPIDAQGKLDAVQRFEKALIMKNAEYSPSIRKGLVLLIDFDAFPFDMYELKEMTEIANRISTDYQSVWVVQFWSEPKGAFKIL
jgi:hypothetical protein